MKEIINFNSVEEKNSFYVIYIKRIISGFISLRVAIKIKITLYYLPYIVILYQVIYEAF